MDKYVFEGLGCPVSGPEEDYFETLQRVISISDLFNGVNIEPLDTGLCAVFSSLNDEYHVTWAADHIKTYRKLESRKFPPIYKVKITLETEPLSDEETEEWWMKQNGM